MFILHDIALSSFVEKLSLRNCDLELQSHPVTSVYYVSSRLMAFPSNCTNRKVAPSLLRFLCDYNRLVVDNTVISRCCSMRRDKTMYKWRHREIYICQISSRSAQKFCLYESYNCTI